ncbi:fatty acid synthase alpha subunit Lsd1 [Coemansia umbellata]|uniref:Fatty acid synthase alpha subunit Lsd1 n=1 Tax=Coemansia umbellata TaxID=1424467 RepID=A0ABQ8PEW0_9FUNG|nr:fatty acid synthase alpha subunit Lsd1 [Coemansia umbellata]
MQYKQSQTSGSADGKTVIKLEQTGVRHGSVVAIELALPSTVINETAELFKSFVNQVAIEIEDGSVAEQFSSEIVVGAKFIEFVANSPDADRATAVALFKAFNSKFCLEQNIHAGASDHGLSGDMIRIVVQAYYAAQEQCCSEQKSQGAALEHPIPRPAVFSTAQFKLLAAFRGQGGMDNYIEETREIYTTYRPLVTEFVEQMTAFLVKEAAETRMVPLYKHGINVLSWITKPETLPEQEYMLTVPVCIPVVGLTQLMQITVLYKTLGITPGQLAASFEEITGHSQGISTATALSMAADEASFYRISKCVLGLLMLTGAFPQLDYPLSRPAVATDLESTDVKQRPTQMVCVLRLTQAQLKKVIEQFNKQQKAEAEYVYLSLINGSRVFVVSGATGPIARFVRKLALEYDAEGVDQSRISFSQRKPRVSYSYISINAPYHCKLLTHAMEDAYRYAEVKGWLLDTREMRCPVRASCDGHDIREEKNLSHYLLKSMCVLPVNWPAAICSPGVTHVVDFGPGGTGGFGELTARILEGRGIPIICASMFAKRLPLASKADLYRTDASALSKASNWAQDFAPKLVRTESDGKLHIDTPMSRLLGKPPVMVAGMTPSTISEVFVSAVMRAGYHIELSGGGHFSEPMLRDKVDKILELVDSGLGISINSIYVNPFLWNIQYPAIQTMRREGIPMEGLCIGAGVPSYDVCNEIIENIRTAGFCHIGLKPSSVATIRLVIKIAQANPDFPILLQWTGGRGGGHHSFEDFHHPILETYGAIRAQKNIVLVAGSGFGGIDDTLPYLTGDWSKRFDCAPMPFDGCLLGSRVMVAKEGAASKSVKEAIVAAPGIDDSEWEKTYKGPAGGIVTVLSELGEPIHKIATRGVLFWKEMDDTVFSLPRDKRLPALLAKKTYIIDRLNKDFQKPWFGKKADGSNADLEEMTYAEVASRLLEVLYIKHQSRWIDITMRNLVGDFLLRLERRFITRECPATLQSFDQINEPFEPVKSILDLYPDCYTQLLTTEDVQFFINLCMRPGQKPVPFIPVMDKDFHIWFKKDSLWQSEDVDAVADQDVGRVCILQGPVAVRYATRVDEPVKDILDNIYHGQIAALLKRYYSGDETKVPTVGYLGRSPTKQPALPYVGIEITEKERIFTLPKAKSQLPEPEAWLEVLAGSELTWLRALLTTTSIVQNHRYESNIVQRVLRPRPGQVVKVALSNEGRPSTVRVIDVSGYRALDISIDANNIIYFKMYSSPHGTACALEFLFHYKPNMPYALIHEVMEGRNERIKRFYAQVWFENSKSAEYLITQDGYKETHYGEELVIGKSDVSSFSHAIGNMSDQYLADWTCKQPYIPLDFAIRAFWPALCKCLMTQVCDGDLTRLVHLSNGFRLFPGAQVMRVGQSAASSAKITEVLDGDSGRTVRVQGYVAVDGKPAIEVDTSFLFRRHVPDFKKNFRHTSEQPIVLRLNNKSILTLLQSKEWFIPQSGSNASIRLNGVLRFDLESQYQFKSPSVYARIVTFGPVYAQNQFGQWARVADVDYEGGAAYKNPVLQFLLQHGAPEVDVHCYKDGERDLVPESQKHEAVVVVPTSSCEYSNVSADHNPIHTSAYFADLVGLPSTIAHGMWTSAATRACIESLVANGDPSRMAAYNTRFIDMVLPGDQLETRIRHIGFVSGRMLVEVEALGQCGNKVIEGLAEIEQPQTVFAFTGQGAHVPGMGMELYASSVVARRIWDSADSFMRNTYGIPLIDIVKNNPSTYTVHFIGKRGAAIRNNYRSMIYEHSKHDGSRLVCRPLFPEIGENTDSFTFFHPKGLLYATQFTQAAMLICEIAEFAHVHAAGVVPENALFAGHSLGEYAGLTAIGGVFSPETAADIGFCRGLTMQQAVRRNASGHSSIYGMVAVSPTRVASWFFSESLSDAVLAIKQHGDYDGLLEIVNYNVRDTQYVVSGELVLLEALSLLLDMLSSTATQEAASKDLPHLAAAAVKAARVRRDKDGGQFKLRRTSSTIPIPGIDVPFHSSLLYDGVWSFRKMLQSKIKHENVSLNKLRHRYIPNLTARPFDITMDYIKYVYSLTHSKALAYLLDTLDTARLEMDQSYMQSTTYTLLVEVLSYQFSSPVRWIETQDVLLRDLEVARFVEIGPGSVLSNMLKRTLDCHLYKQEGSAAILKKRLKILCSAADMDEILHKRIAVSSEPSPKGTATKEQQSLALAHSNKANAANTVQEASHITNIQPVEERTAAGSAMGIEDVGIQPLEAIRALIAHKLKQGIESVDDKRPIKDFVGGKSTLQNEIIGDLQKEFKDDFPEKPEEIPLNELAQGLSSLDQTLGGHSLGLIARLVSNKLPGGITKAYICRYFKDAYGLGPLRQQGALLVALTMEPGMRLDSETSTKRWLDTVAHMYAKTSGITFRSQSGSEAQGKDGSSAEGSGIVAINSKEFIAAQNAQYKLTRRAMEALAEYLGASLDPSTSIRSNPSSICFNALDLDAWSAEFSPAFLEGIKPRFSLPMVRRFDSFWNWARQDLLELYYGMIRGKITKVDLNLIPHCLHLANRFTPSIVHMLQYLVKCSEEGDSTGHALAKKYGSNLLGQIIAEGEATPPAYQFTQRLLAPCLTIGDLGEIKYIEVNRAGETNIHAYVRTVTSLGCGFAQTMSANSQSSGGALDIIFERLGLQRSNSAHKQANTLPPMVHLRRRVVSPVSGWEFDPELSAEFGEALTDICDNGLTLSGKCALVTGCGEGSIGAEVLRGLLESGAHVIATTSSYSEKTMRYFQSIYQTHGSRGSSLVVVPFNQASQQDIAALVAYIYGESTKGKGLALDLDYVLPFAAIPDLGHDITELDSRSELALRAMLTNTFRLLGEIATHKAKQRLDLHPTLAILPLSPNHGAFGMDGLYSESKIGLETLMHRWHSETQWQPYISISGAVIGWTRGTGLMAGNNVLAECVERTGVRTFSAGEVAFNILGLLHPRMYALAAQSPVWADMAGRFQYYPEVTRSIVGLRQALNETEAIFKASTADSRADFSASADEDSERIYKLQYAGVLSNHQFKFPEVKSPEQLSKIRNLQGMVNLDKVVVVTGYGEVGPYGNAETRWEMEAFGEFSLEGCIELAWIMGLIKHFNGKHRGTGKLYTGWVDAKTEEPVPDRYIKARYEKTIIEHTGIRLIEPESINGYDPNKKTLLRELQIEHDMEPFEATEEEATQFKLKNGDRVHIWQNENSGGTWSVRFLKGATVMIPKALRFDRLVAAQVPTGWDPVRYGIPKNIADQIDPITCYALVATAEALIRSGITDPYEIYRYVHVSEVGSSTGTALGGLKSAKRVFAERMCDKDHQADIYQETFLSTVPAWINMLLLSSSGPIKTTIGACATGIASIDVAVETIQAGKAKIMLAGGTDGISEESSYEFAQMNATSSAASEQMQGRAPREMSRPCTSTRNGFMEGEGAGIVTLMAASTAIKMGAPIYGIIAATNTATDKEGRSIPAPGKGILTTARELPRTKAMAQLLDIAYRRRQLEFRLGQIDEWQLEFIEMESNRLRSEALDTWGNEFWKRNPYIAPLRGALAVWGLTIDDIGIVSFHGTSTKANDKNESEIVEQQLRHLGRTPGNVVFSICQKYLTGHPKGPASIWMLNGVLQSLHTGIVPGNRNADNIAAELEQYEYIVYPSRSIQTTGIKAGLLKSFGFGQVGAECLVVHPDYLFATLAEEQLEQYRCRVSQREAGFYRYKHDILAGIHPLVQVKESPPYTSEQEESLYLNPLQRLTFGNKI